MTKTTLPISFVSFPLNVSREHCDLDYSTFSSVILEHSQVFLHSFCLNSIDKLNDKSFRVKMTVSQCNESLQLRRPFDIVMPFF